MRWADLFADLEGEAEGLAVAELQAEVRDRTRREVALLHLSDRLSASPHAMLRLRVDGAGVLGGAVLDSGPDWVLVEESGHEVLVPLAAVLAVTGLSARTAAPGSEGAVGRRLDLGYALRGLARSRVGLSVLLRDATRLAGSLDRVGADYVEVAEHPPGEPRRIGAVRAVTLVPHTALGLLRST